MKAKSSNRKWEAFWGLLVFSLFVAYASAHAEEPTFGESTAPCDAASDTRELAGTEPEVESIFSGKKTSDEAKD